MKQLYVGIEMLWRICRIQRQDLSGMTARCMSITWDGYTDSDEAGGRAEIRHLPAAIHTIDSLPQAQTRPHGERQACTIVNLDCLGSDASNVGPFSFSCAYCMVGIALSPKKCAGSRYLFLRYRLISIVSATFIGSRFFCFISAADILPGIYYAKRRKGLEASPP